MKRSFRIATESDWTDGIAEGYRLKAFMVEEDGIVDIILEDGSLLSIPFAKGVSHKIMAKKIKANTSGQIYLFF
jgi:hypothetical protein